MFDEPKPPTNLPTGASAEPEDMFAKVEPVSAPAAAKPVGPAAPPSSVGTGAPPPTAAPAPAPAPAPVSEPPVEVQEPLVGSRKKIIVLGVIVGVVVVGGILYGALRFIRGTATAPQAPVQLDAIAPFPEPTPSAPATPDTSLEPVAPAAEEAAPALDTDSDGLTDEEEAALGIDPGNPDSDTDGLFDREEIYIYETDPLNPDTDGDTYLDGQEVQNGYNPKGEGRLFTVPSQ